MGPHFTNEAKTPRVIGDVPTESQMSTTAPTDSLDIQPPSDTFAAELDYFRWYILQMLRGGRPGDYGQNQWQEA